MNIVKRLADNVVLYRGDLLLTSAGVSGEGWADPTTTTENSALVDGEDLPHDWIGGAYSFSDGVWTLVDGSLLPKTPVPQSVPKKSGKQALILTGHWTPLLNYVNALPEPDKTWALVQINDSETYRRDDDFLIQAAKALGMTDKDLDALFVLAGAQ